MKKIYFLLFTIIGLLGVNVANAQVIFTEDFDYPTGAAGDSIGGGPGTTTALGDTIWKKHSGTATGGRAVKYSTTSLTFPNYAGSGIGGAANFQHTVGSADVNGNLISLANAATTSGSLYTSFMLRIDSSAGTETSTDYFFHYCDAAGTSGLSNFRLRLFAANGSSATTYKLGLSKGSSSTLTGTQKLVYTSTEFTLGQTYLVVAKYTFNTTTSKDDEINLFVIPTTIPLTEPTPDVSLVDTTYSDLTSIKSICVRQGSVGRTLGAIDGFRVFKTWDDFITFITPVQLINFTTQKNNASVDLNWLTAQEINSQSFVIQRSANGSTWTDIANTSAAGNSSTTKSYSATDKNPILGFNYYRLKEVGKDGKVYYSDIKKVLFSNTYKVLVTPNPVKDVINVYVSKNNNESVKVKVIDGTGKVVRSAVSNQSQIQISAEGLSKGVYAVKIFDNNNVTTQKILVQ